MLELYFWILATLTLDAGLLLGLYWMFHSPRFASHRLVPGAGMQVNMGSRLRMSALTTVISLSSILGGIYLGFDYLFTEVAQPLWHMALGVVVILLVYDFIYYFAHRAMHHPALLRHVHGIHHRARNPSATESFYQHPAELVIGLVLIFGSVFAARFLLGPIHIHTLAATFFIYSTVNILVHSGMETKSALFYPLDWLTKKHHAHHHGDPMKNFSTMTPLPDLVFGTMEPFAGPKR